LGDLFPRQKLRFNFGEKNPAWATFWAIFSQTHLVTLTCMHEVVLISTELCNFQNISAIVTGCQKKLLIRPNFDGQQTEEERFSALVCFNGVGKRMTLRVARSYVGVGA
jgi:hypothetical protein